MSVFDALHVVAAGQDGVITARQCLDLGLSRNQIATLCRRRHLQRLFWGTYLVNADLVGEPSARTRIRSALLSAGTSGVAVLDTAAELLGIAGARPGDRPVHVACPPGSGRRQRVVDRDLRYREQRIVPAEVMVIDGMRVSSAARTVADLILDRDRLTAVSILDSALNRGLITFAELEDVAGNLAGRRGAGPGGGVLRDADARAESPLETRARLRSADGGVPPDDLQAHIYDGTGTFLARVDMLWRRYRVIGEADGAEIHDRPDALYRDRERQNALVAAGFTVIRFTWADTLRPTDIPDMVRAAQSAALHRS